MLLCRSVEIRGVKCFAYGLLSVRVLLLLLGTYTSGALEIITRCSEDDILIAPLLTVLRCPFLGIELGDNPEKLGMCLFKNFLLWTFQHTK